MSKIRLKYCLICKKDTEHSTPIYGMPFECRNEHTNDKTHCRGCGDELNETTKSIMSGLGASSTLCKKCTTSFISAIRQSKK